MATVNLDLYVLSKSDRFVTSLTNPSPPTLPTITAGDTWNCNVYFVDGSPMQIVARNSDVSARFRAAGNNHGYGDSAPTQTRIGPASSAIHISRITQGVKGTTEEVQRVLLPAAPTGGSYVLNFPGPTVVDAPSAVVGPMGSITVQSNWTITQIRDAIRALPFFVVFNAVIQSVPQAYAQFVTLSGTPTDYQINYANGSDRKGPLNLCFVSTNTLQFLYGWNVSVPLTASDFTDLFLSANGPSYFEVMLDGNQAGFIQLTGAPSGGGNAPAFANGPPQPNGSTGSPFSFAYSVTGFPAPTFAVTAGALPTGLSLSADGGISGTPTVAGTFSGVVTITNATSSAAQAFSIAIVTGSSGGVFSVIGVLFDGSYDNPVAQGPPVISHGIPDDASALIWRQKYHQRESGWTPLGMGGQSCPYSSGAVAVDETPLQWTGIGDVMEFERVWALIPGSRRRPGSYAKTYKSQKYNVVNGQIDASTFSIASRTAIIGADYLYDYFNIVTQGIPIPAIMDISVVHNGPFHSYELYGGFPPGTTAAFGTNYAYCLIGVDTRPYMGPIWERLLVYGQ